MYVKDERTGERIYLDHTPELIADLAALPKACDHTNKEIRKRTDRGGAVHYYSQCAVCGQAIGSAVKRPDNFDDSRLWDESLADTYRLSREASRNEILQKHIRKQRDQTSGLSKKYSEYLKSPEWHTKRALVLKRAGNICEGCLTAAATQVHHKTYKHAFHEFMFELVALCEPCHERIHSDRNNDASSADDTPAESEWADGFPCEACRWQFEQDGRRWCSALDVAAKEALAVGGECGPRLALLEGLK